MLHNCMYREQNEVTQINVIIRSRIIGLPLLWETLRLLRTGIIILADGHKEQI